MLQKIKEWFENQEQQRSWVMVVDNVNDFNVYCETKDLDTAPLMIQDYVPSSGHGFILFTTRCQKTGGILADPDKIFMVNEMTKIDCIKLMRKKLPSVDYDVVDLEELAEELEHLPLALTQGTAYLDKQKEPVS
jgi:hypothetical protein